MMLNCVRGEASPVDLGEAVEEDLGDVVLGDVVFAPLVSFLELAWRSCVARVPRTRRGDV